MVSLLTHCGLVVVISHALMISSGTRSQCYTGNSISLVFILTFVLNSSTSNENRNLWPACSELWLFAPLCRFAPWLVHPLALLPLRWFSPLLFFPQSLADLPPGLFTLWLFCSLAHSPPSWFSPWLIHPLADSPSVSGWFAPWLVRPLADSPSGLFAPWFFRPLTLDVLPPLNTGNSTLRFRQFMHDDDNKRLCECLMLCLILK